MATSKLDYDTDVVKRQLNPTWFLYDDGEEDWPLKLHLGNGGVFLVDSGTGYVNIDIAGIDSGQECDLVLIPNRTNIQNYYARLEWYHR